MLMLIGLVGYAQTGKDTAAEEAVKQGWKRIAFADPLRDLVYALNPIFESGTGEDSQLLSIRQAIDEAGGYEEAKRVVPGFREVYQLYGEKVRAVCGENVWIDAAINRMEPGSPHIFTDVRYVNEAEELLRRGALLIRVNREGFGPANGHSSETEVDAIECHVDARNVSSREAWQESWADSLRTLSTPAGETYFKFVTTFTSLPPLSQPLKQEEGAE